ncbi:hypothetical protein GQ43DRAFT_477294 [Delitschia confertaspora ATCC 74209]|uniref:Uncharacterized protein n=1 Tax=Delitschia confertaspora ATCC 74209 TaxID=1513339 RepID=A0A9P4JUT0_9PLEO|nr:hypothetical protein GQ43DRAFT_477294 [Delitschia confertaspora ATCC 74209]
MVDKLPSKHRWRGKLFSKNDEGLTKKEEKDLKLTADVTDFLKPSTEKAQQHRDAAAAAFLAGANKPKIDVAMAQRWPGASDVLGSAKDRSPLPSGGLKKGRKRVCTVSFARTQPEIIGEGGDECEDPSIEVSMRKKSNSVSGMDKVAVQEHRDDLHLTYNSNSPLHGDHGSLNTDAQRRGIVHRTLTNPGELSPPLQQKMQLGLINTHAVPPPPPPQRLGPMGLGERPRPLQRAPTGFDIADDGVSRPSLDSTYSYEGDMSPHASRKAPAFPPTQEEEEDFVPKPLKRTQTGYSEITTDSDDEGPPPMPGLKRTQTGWSENTTSSSGEPIPPLPQFSEDDSPVDRKKQHFLESEPSDPNSFSARVKHQLEAEEGQALHQAFAHGNGNRKRYSDESSSLNSFQAGSPLSIPPGSPPAYHVPSAYAYGRTPPRPLHERAMSPPAQNFSDPSRSRARPLSPPARKPMPPAKQLVLDTEARPSSSGSSHHTIPSAASRNQPSPYVSYSATTLASSQQTPSSAVKTPYSSFNHHNQSSASISLTPSSNEKPTYFPAVASPESKSTKVPMAANPSAHDLASALPASLKSAGRLRNDSAAQHLSHSNTQSDAMAQGEVAYDDFAERVVHMQGIFRLTAELQGSIYEHSPMKWLRVASWWFLQGRAGMEALIRSRPKGEPPGPERLTQPHVDVAKTWWIVAEVIHNHPALRKYGEGKMEQQARLAREAGDGSMAEIYEAHDAVMYYLKLLLSSIRRHQAMPPTQALIQGQNQSIWVQYPQLDPDAQRVLSGSFMRSGIVDGSAQQQLNPTQCIPLGDTKTDFCYSRMFVKVSMAKWSEEDHMPAVLSVMRPRDEFGVKLAICTQNELVTVFVQSNPKTGPTWRDVQWRVKTRSISITVQKGYTIDVQLGEPDFRSLWAIVDHTTRVELNLKERENERVLLKLALHDFSYKDPTDPQAFPAERVKGCKAIIFERCDRSDEGTGKRRLHRGYRVLVVTNTKNRTLSCINHEVGKQEPLNFEFRTDSEGGHPAMFVLFKSDSQTPNQKPKICTAYFVFNDGKDRNYLYGTLTSANMSQDESVVASVPLKCFDIENADPAEGFTHSGRDVLKKFHWQDLKVLNQDPERADLESAPVLMSENLRLVCRHGAGTLTDRMNLDTGELLIRLPTDGMPEVTMLRPAQRDMALAIDASKSEPHIPEALAELLRLVTSASTLRTLTFHTNKDLHSFQLAVTGFHVRFDGIASTFQISRRRMVVPIYKQWSASQVRLQIVQQDSIIQLLAFFTDFSHADAMNFVLKPQDVFEKVDKSGKSCVRLVDAKFALPVEERKGEGKMEKEEGRRSGWAGGKRRFVCLDLVEYPGEHDDILIGFDGEEVRGRFLEALPAKSKVERKMTFKKRSKE